MGFVDRKIENNASVILLRRWEDDEIHGTLSLRVLLNLWRFGVVSSDLDLMAETSGGMCEKIVICLGTEGSPQSVTTVFPVCKRRKR